MLRSFQGVMAQSLGLSCPDHGDQLGVCHGRISMCTSLPDPAALAEALLLPWPLPLAPPLSDLFYHGHFMPLLAPLLTIPAKDREVGGLQV